MRPSFLAKLPVMGDLHAQRRATPKVTRVGALPTGKKPLPTTQRVARRPEVVAAERRCIATVWKRDQSRSRASGVAVIKGHESEHHRGEVAHLASRSTSPAKKWDSSNCVLLTAEEHRLSDPRTAPGGKVLLVIRGKNARKVLTFTRLSFDGQVLWTRKSPPPPPLPKEPSA